MKPKLSQADLPKPGPVGKDEQAKSELTSKQDMGRKVTKNLNYSPDEFAQLYDTIQKTFQILKLKEKALKI